MILGVPCCREAFRATLNVGCSKLTKLRKHLLQGYSDHPVDLRHSSHTKAAGSGEEREICNGFFTYLWNNAEAFADDDPTDKAKVGQSTFKVMDYGEVIVKTPAVVDNCSEWVMGIGGTQAFTEANDGDVRWIPRESMTDLYEHLRAWCSESGLTCPSYITMYRVYGERWSGRLKMKTPSEQSKCNDCETFKQLRKLATSAHDHQRVTEAYHLHLRNAVYRPRAVQAHLAACSQRSLSGLIPWDDIMSLLRTCIDAMDQAKLKMPSATSMAKQFQTMWRPNCLLVGCIAFNLLEIFFIVDPGVAKDSNLEITLLCRLLELVADDTDGIMPAQWSNECDNAAGEGKNQIVAKFYAWQVWKDKFQCVETTQNSVGHTHGEQDQRFSEASGVVKKAGNVETPNQFCSVLERGVVPRKGRKLVVEHVEESLDFKKFFEDLEVNMSGHVQTHKMGIEGLEACHVWRFVCRKNLNWTGDVQTAWPDLEPHPSDVILLVKHHIDDPSYSQEPLVFCPHVNFQKLGRGPVSHGRHVGLSYRQQRGFTKTAEKIAQRPWLMTDASEWLQGWLERVKHDNYTDCSPPDISWAFSDRQAGHELHCAAKLIKKNTKKIKSIETKLNGIRNNFSFRHRDRCCWSCCCFCCCLCRNHNKTSGKTGAAAEAAAAPAAAASLFERKINFDSIQFDFSQFDLCAIL